MNTLVKLNPFGEVDELQSRLDSFLFNGFQNRMRFQRRFENGDELRKEDVKVTVENGVLFITGERKAEKEEKKKKFHRIERAFGRFERTFTLPDGADPTKIVADFKDGVLKIHLPKFPMAKVKPIEVKVQ